MKTLLSSVGMVVLLCGMAMAQDGPMMMGHAGPGKMFMERGGAETMPFPPPGDAFYFRGRTHMGGPMHGMMGQWWKNPELAQKVGLSDDQTAKLDKISYESKLQMIDLRATLEKEQLMLGQQLQADQPNKDEVLGQVDKVSQARAAVARARVQTMLSTRSVLTADQWKKLKAARMDFHHGPFMWRGRGEGFGGHGFGGHGMPMKGETPPKP
jgi:Spy/CpxP family protein refolding chaperone